eukprot:scaffold5271_cov71-Isochrysis_galbana.AAC.2
MGPVGVAGSGNGLACAATSPKLLPRPMPAACLAAAPSRALAALPLLSLSMSAHTSMCLGSRSLT